MDMDLNYIKKCLSSMVVDKLDNMSGCEITYELYEFLVNKESQVVEAAFELFKNNAIVNKDTGIRAKDAFTYDLINAWDYYNEFSDVDNLTDEVIDNCSKETMDKITYDALYNYDALWMTAIHRAFPDDTTNTQCGCGYMDLVPTEVKLKISNYDEYVIKISRDEYEELQNGNIDITEFLDRDDCIWRKGYCDYDRV